MTLSPTPSKFRSTLHHTARTFGATILCAFLLWGATAPSSPSTSDPSLSVMPAYDAEQNLLLPSDYTRWVFLGSSLGMSYSENAPSHDMFHHTLMEPSAYEHFTRTGEFREGTMLALLLHGTAESVLPQRHGRFAAEIHGVEMAVKDSSRVDETWAYYNFGGRNGIRNAASPMPARSCQSCHVEHAAHDNVFVQFYPMLVDAAPENSLPAALSGAFPSEAEASRQASQSRQEEEPAAQPLAPLALTGLDPVHLAQGREEMGKPEIAATHKGHTYQFVSKPSQQAFNQDPDRYSIQNATCPVVPGAPIDPSLFAVHEEHIYAFATPGCISQFEAAPESFLSDDG